MICSSPGISPVNSCGPSAGCSRLYRFFARPWFAVGIPLLFLVTLTLWLRFGSADLRVVELFFDGPTQSWPLRDRQPWHLLYSYGTYPGWTLGIGSASLWLWRLRSGDRVATWGAFCALTVLLGPGLIVNTLLKPHFHRPRPNQLEQFGGQYRFVPVLSVLGTDETRSFPSGHASMGFYLMTPAFVMLRRRPRLAAWLLVLGMTSGLVLGLTRIVQGKHFPSDVLWSWAVVYYSSLTVYYSLRLPHRDTLAESTENSVDVLDHSWAGDRLARRKEDAGGQSTVRSAA